MFFDGTMLFVIINGSGIQVTLGFNELWETLSFPSGTRWWLLAHPESLNDDAERNPKQFTMGMVVTNK